MLIVFVLYRKKLLLLLSWDTAQVYVMDRFDGLIIGFRNKGKVNRIIVGVITEINYSC